MSRLLPATDLQKVFRLAACLGLAGVSTDAWAQSFTVTSASGSAYVGSSANPSDAAKVSSSYNLPSWGRTGDGSYLTIAFNAENKFRLLPNSEAEVKVGDGDSGSSWHRVVSLKIGTASLDHNTGSSPSVHLDCETPTAICGAVGTAFEVNATEGIYSVSSGAISVDSSSEGDSLRLASIQSGGSATFNPGRENTFSKADYSGRVVINGRTFTASGANFTVAKAEGSSSQTAVHISSGSLGGTGPGSYLMDGGQLVPVDSGKKASLHAQYLAAAQEEGALNARLAADRAANRGSGGLSSQVASAAARATDLRQQLFNRETVREVNKKVTEEVINSTVRSATQAARSAIPH